MREEILIRIDAMSGRLIVNPASGQRSMRRRMRLRRRVSGRVSQNDVRQLTSPILGGRRDIVNAILSNPNNGRRLTTKEALVLEGSGIKNQ